MFGHGEDLERLSGELELDGSRSRKPPWHRWAARGLAAVVGLVIMVVAAVSPQFPHSAQAKPAGTLDAAFAIAAQTYAVPKELLEAIAYAQTHLEHHDGEPSGDGGYGLMHLVRGGTLTEAARLTGTPIERLKNDPASNIRGGAAVLRSYVDNAPRPIEQWYEAVARYSGADDPRTARMAADDVFDLLGSGFAERGVRVSPRVILPERGRYARLPQPEVSATDFVGAAWVAATTRNFTGGSRPRSDRIDKVVIHVTQGSATGTIAWFQNPRSEVSAHYVVTSRTGQVTQMVRERDVAWHAGNWDYNVHSVGIEHEGWVSDATWFTDTMYRASAKLTRAICERYGIPRDRKHIIGHGEVPKPNNHTDPGKHWNWTKYMSMVNGGSGGGGPVPSAAPSPKPSVAPWTATLDNSGAGVLSASAAWATGDALGGRHGVDYRSATVLKASDPAWYRAAPPAAGTYRVEVWYPAHPSNNDRAPYIVATTKGNVTVYVDQRITGGEWRELGDYPLAAGAHDVVGVSRWTGGTGTIIADAVRLTRV